MRQPFFGASLNKMIASVNRRAFYEAVGFLTASVNVWAVSRKIIFKVVHANAATHTSGGRRDLRPRGDVGHGVLRPRGGAWVLAAMAQAI